MKSGTVEHNFTDDFLPGGPRERVITYYAPFGRNDWEKDYEVAWEKFGER